MPLQLSFPTPPKTGPPSSSWLLFSTLFFAGQTDRLAGNVAEMLPKFRPDRQMSSDLGRIYKSGDTNPMYDPPTTDRSWHIPTSHTAHLSTLHNIQLQRTNTEYKTSQDHGQLRQTMYDSNNQLIHYLLVSIFLFLHYNPAILHI